MPEGARDSLMTQIRKSRGQSLAEVAEAVGCDDGNLSRLERGIGTPQRPLARKLFQFYGGAVPLGLIYDPTFSDSEA